MKLEAPDIAVLRLLFGLGGGRATQWVDVDELEKRLPFSGRECADAVARLARSRFIDHEQGQVVLTLSGLQTLQEAVATPTADETKTTFRELREAARRAYEQRVPSIQTELVAQLREVSSEGDDRRRSTWEAKSLEHAIDLYERAGTALVFLIEEVWHEAARAVEVHYFPDLRRMVVSDMRKLMDDGILRLWAALRSASVHRGALDSHRLRIADKIIEQELAAVVQRFGSPPSIGGGSTDHSADQGSDEVIRVGDVFLVHGRDELLKEQVARFLMQGGVRVSILAEKASRGRSLIEKFECHAVESNFAVVLLTPDDSCEFEGLVTRRARQNVIFELGFFIGSLGRDRVCAIYSPGVELPSDYPVAYIDSTRGWRLELARELRAAGFDFTAV